MVAALPLKPSTNQAGYRLGGSPNFNPLTHCQIEGVVNTKVKCLDLSACARLVTTVWHPGLKEVIIFELHDTLLEADNP